VRVVLRLAVALGDPRLKDLEDDGVVVTDPVVIPVVF